MSDKFTLVWIVVAELIFSVSVAAMETKPYLTLDMAKRITDVCEAKAAAEGWRKISIAIYDDGGNLKLFRRQDSAVMHSVQVSQLKGGTSAGFPRSTRALGEIAFPNPERPHGIEQVSGFAVFPGGLPIIAEDGTQIGGVGVSGATGEEDEACAQAGLDAITELLK